jgi:RNA polymerase sigma-B factor
MTGPTMTHDDADTHGNAGTHANSEQTPDERPVDAPDRDRERAAAVVLEQFRRWRLVEDPSENARMRDELITEHRWLAQHCARRFHGRGEPMDDLTQVAMIGLCQAVDRFDPEYGSSFPSFAIPTILGVVRRYFRDATWAVKVPRRAKDLSLEITAATDQLTRTLQRSPTPAELAEVLHVEVDAILEGLEAAKAYRAAPLTPPGEHRDGERDSSDDNATLGSVDGGFELTETRMLIRGLLDQLPERERTILEMRFFDDLTQSEIAECVGISQVHVSRLLRASLQRLQRHLHAGSGEPPAPTEMQPPLTPSAATPSAATPSAATPSAATPSFRTDFT